MKPIKWITLGLALLAILSVAAVYFLRTHDSAFTDEGLLQANAADLQHSIVTPHLETPIEDGMNVLWCGTFQLAWNEACTLIGEELHLENEPAMVDVLNKKSFTKQDIDAESYVAVAGYVKDDIHGQIQRQLEETFGGKATPQIIPPIDPNPGPNDFIAYAYLFKNLEFPVPFERIEKPIVFGSEEVPCFGIGEDVKEIQEKLRGQFVILEYQSEDDFVIEFKTKSEGDRVILAKLQPKPTLEATIAEVQKRSANPEPTQPAFLDVLKIPKLNFDVVRKYDELVGQTLIAKNPAIPTNLVITSAMQDIRFQFDEQGARLRSEGELTSKSLMSKIRHIMIFDKPFLIMLQRSNADVPYFALWVGNAELLVKSKK